MGTVRQLAFLNGGRPGRLLAVASGLCAAAGGAGPAALWREDYGHEPFVEVANAPPSLREVVGRNVVRVYVTVAANTRRPALIVISAIDNLIKGAGGQAVQNANVMLGLDECAGLPR